MEDTPPSLPVCPPAHPPCPCCCMSCRARCSAVNKHEQWTRAGDRVGKMDDGGRRTFLLQMLFGSAARPEPQAWGCPCDCSCRLCSHEYELQCMDREWHEGMVNIEFEIQVREQIERSEAGPEARDQGHATEHILEELAMIQQRRA